MEINLTTSAERLEQKFWEEINQQPQEFLVLLPNFFDFYRKSFEPDEIIEPVAGVKIKWTAGSNIPVIIFEDFKINESAQLFYQEYRSILSESPIR